MKLGLDTNCMRVWYCRVILRRGRGTKMGIRERPGPSPAATAINLLLLSNEMIYILSRGYIYRTIFSTDFSDLILEPRDAVFL